jgi:hypothetical protein
MWGLGWDGLIDRDTPGTGVVLLGFWGCGGAWVVLDVGWVFVWIMVRGERGFFEGGVLSV